MAAPLPLPVMVVSVPGEGSLRVVEKHTDELPLFLLVAAIVPVVVLGISLKIIAMAHGESSLGALVGAAGIYCVTAFGCVGLFHKKMNKIRSYYLGYIGERIVAEQLEPLKLKGCRVFHDMPCKVGSPFNIDHIVIAPTGIFAIETKAHRKPQGNSGDKIRVNNGRLIAPWKDAQKDLEQAGRQAAWLSSWLEDLIGEQLPVQGVLVPLGWFVTPERGAIWVLNDTYVAGDILSRGRGVLSPQKIDLIARQIENRCRDVEY
jgi:hypothetical protein